MNFKDFCVSVWKKLKVVFKKVIALICDEDFDLDVYRIVGIASYSSAIFVALKLVSLVSSLSDLKLGILSGLVTALAGIGSTMFSHARKGDSDRIAR